MKDYASENTVPADEQWSDNRNVLTVRRGGRKKVLFFGNSITRHEPKPEIGWSGSWGMAASAKEKDYVHLVLSALEQQYGTVDYCIASASKWERSFWREEAPEATYASARDFCADIVIIRMGENVLREDYDTHDFRTAADRIIRYLSPSGKATVVVTDPFWFHAAMAEDFRVIAEQNGYLYCHIGDLSRDERNMAIGKFEHRGVSCHPGDLGMARIAERILCSFKRMKGSVHQMMNQSEKLSVMSFNLYFDNITEDREQRVLKTILNAMPDTLGVQECTRKWREFLDAELAPYYESVGEYRENRTHTECAAVYYRKDKFTLLESATKWLSDTPDVISKYESAFCPRVGTYVHLRRNSDGMEFVHLNTHLDHVGAQGEQANRLVEMTAPYHCPVFITGDFNQESNCPGYRNIIAAGFTDSGKAATVREHPERTFDPERIYQNRDITIDYCFFQGENVSADLYRVITDQIDGKYPSDHFPVYFEFGINA